MFIDPVIYAIVNIVDDKHYVGQTYNKSKRFREHIKTLDNQAHCNVYLQRAWSKCGKSSFIFVVLENLLTVELLTQREQYWIDALKPEYNLAPVAGSPLGYKHTDEARANMAKAQTGKKHSAETRAKMSASKIGNQFNTGRKQNLSHIESRAKFHRGKITSEETKAKMSEAQKGRVLTAEHRIKLSVAARNRVKRDKSVLT